MIEVLYCYNNIDNRQNNLNDLKHFDILHQQYFRLVLSVSNFIHSVAILHMFVLAYAD